MIDFNMMILGVRLWLWLYFLMSIVLGLGVAIYFYRETIKKKYYEIRFPEKIVKVVIHHKNNMFKNYWRLIPDNNIFTIGNMTYAYNDKRILKENDFFVRGKKPSLKIKVEDKEYDYEDGYLVKNRWKKYAEIHYFHNDARPIGFEQKKESEDIDAKQLKDFKDNDLFTKLLTLRETKNMFIILIMIGLINVAGTIIILGKMLEWF